ncbi:MAG: hypothetical protein ACP5QR_01425 [Rhizomicrobium sp.]
MRRFLAMAVFAAGVALAVVSQAQAMPRDRGPEPGPAPERAQPQRGGRGQGPAPAFNRAMPPQGFRAAPPDFRGRLPGPGQLSGDFHRRPGFQVHPDGRFRGHRFERFSPPERRLWERGGWRHTWHDGHLGWWWVVSGDWFFYPQPIYPYPLYVGPPYYYDYYNTYGPPSYYWYYCEDPPGYYPYVPRCYVPWQPVPPVSE